MYDNFTLDLDNEQKQLEAYKHIVLKVLGTNTLKANYNSNYDLLLDDNKTVEVKVDYRSLKTGNIAIEVANKQGNPSGISVSNSNYWLHIALLNVYEDFEYTYGIYLWETEKLSAYIKFNKNLKNVDYPNQIVLIPLSKIEKHKVAHIVVCDSILESITLYSDKQKLYF